MPGSTSHGLQDATALIWSLKVPAWHAVPVELEDPVGQKYPGVHVHGKQEGATPPGLYWPAGHAVPVGLTDRPVQALLRHKGIGGRAEWSP